MADQPSRTPTFVSLGLIFTALVISAIGGFSEGSVLGAIVAGVAIVPAAIGMWQGMQEKTQGSLALAIGTFLLALLVAGILVVLKVVSLF